jgi:hypothetical protein
LEVPMFSSLPRNHNNPLAKCGCKKHCKVDRVAGSQIPTRPNAFRGGASRPARGPAPSVAVAEAAPVIRPAFPAASVARWKMRSTVLRERVLFIGTQFSIRYTSMYSPAEATAVINKHTPPPRPPLQKSFSTSESARATQPPKPSAMTT